MAKLENSGTAGARGDLKCLSCNHVADIDTYLPAMSVYQDVRCPVCGSTNNEHNAAYQDRLMENMRKATSK